MDCFMGTILPWPIPYEPMGWMFCNGQTLRIQENTALYSLIGTTYGGDGASTFCLPNLQGRIPLGAGQGPNTAYTMGQSGGVETVTLTAGQMPAHTHSIAASSDAASIDAPGPNVYPAQAAYSREPVESYASTSNTTLPPTGANGGNQPHENRQPYLVLNYIICVSGIYPVRQ